MNSSFCLRLSRSRRLPIQHLHQLRHPALQRVRQPHERSKRRHFRAALEVADGGDARSAAFGELSLGEAAGEADFAEAFAEDVSFVAAIGAHSGRVAVDKRYLRIYPF